MAAPKSRSRPRRRSASACPSPIFLFTFCIFFHFCTALDAITKNQSMTEGHSLVSQGKVYELGFFSPKNSNKRFLGIWFHQVSIPTIVWVANREHPLTDLSGVLTIRGDGNLVVLDGTGNALWSSNASEAATSPTVALLDTGKLVLRDTNPSNGDGKVLWESFDHPGDSFLPTMELVVNLKTGQRSCLTSWKSEEDPAAGTFVFCMDRVVIPQMLIWKGNDRFWRSGQWNGKIFIGRPFMYDVYINGPMVYVDLDQGVIRYTHSYFTNSYSRLLLDWNGKLEQKDWNGKEWIVGWAEKYTECDVYNRCGQFGVCTEFVSPICRCLTGFQPKSDDDWKNGNWSGGCVRRTQLNCSSAAGEGDGFLRVEKMKTPDFSNWVQGMDSMQCRDMCLKNCSCVAYAYPSGIGCMVWSGELIDIQYFPGRGGEDFYIRLAKSELGNDRDTKKIVGITVPLAVVLVGICGFIIWWMTKHRVFSWKMRKMNQSDLNTNVVEDELRHEDKQLRAFTGGNRKEMGTRKTAGNARLSLQDNTLKEVPIFDFKIVAVATNSFSDANKIGEGGYGPVYMGMLPQGQEVAVKRLSTHSGQGVEEFKNEVMLISRLQHRNLVRLLGCCIESEERMLLYEYMQNKSLDSILFDTTKKRVLNWERRFHIIVGIARGLLYLHRDSPLKIIHRDLKASNVLLDGRLNPKISDFGTARIFGADQILATTKKVIGTYGYMSPEYAMKGRFSEKSDVFSFGVLLLEIVSGIRNTSPQLHKDSLCLLGYAWRLWNENEALAIADPSLECSYAESEVLRCIQVGLLCVQEFAADRPIMSTVVSMLGSETASLPSPKQPAFTLSRSSTRADSHRTHQVSSTSDLTITVINGR